MTMTRTLWSRSSSTRPLTPPPLLWPRPDSAGKETPFVLVWNYTIILYLYDDDDDGDGDGDGDGDDDEPLRPPPSHHYDNDPPAAPVYSVVKPRVKPHGPPLSATPLYDMPPPANHRPGDSGAHHLSPGKEERRRGGEEERRRGGEEERRM